MKIYGWVPDSYGPWAYVLAESPEAAVVALEKSKADIPSERWDYEYYAETIDEFLKRPPDVEYEVGQVIHGEVA